MANDSLTLPVEGRLTPTSHYNAGMTVRTALAIAFTILVWSSAFAGIRASLRPGAYHPGHLTLLRFLSASVTLAFCALFARLRLPERKDMGALTLVGLLSVTIYHTALNFGQVTVGAGAASFLINTAPVFTALLATLFLGEKLKLWGWVGILLSFGGAILIARSGGKEFRLEPGALLIMLSAVSASIYMVMSKPILKKYTALEMSCYCVWIGTAFLVIFAPGFVTAVKAAPLSATIAAIYLGIFPAALAYITWSYTLAHLPASRTASFLYLMPGLATLVAWLWLGEVPRTTTFIGGGLALLGVILVNTWGKVKPAANEKEI